MANLDNTGENVYEMLLDFGKIQNVTKAEYEHQIRKWLESKEEGGGHREILQNLGPSPSFDQLQFLFCGQKNHQIADKMG